MFAFAPAPAAVARYVISESDRETYKSKILEILDEINQEIADEMPRLFGANDSDDDDDDEEQQQQQQCGEAAAEDDGSEVQWVPCGAGEGSGSAAARHASPAKRSRVTDTSQPAPRMVVSASTLKVTDTDSRTLLRAHRFVLKMFTQESMLMNAKSTSPNLLVGIFMAAVSTPFAALYLDMNPTNRVYRNVRDTIAFSVDNSIKSAFSDECLPHAEKLALDVCDNWSNPKKTPLQQLFNLRVKAIIDGAMEKIMGQLVATRALWKERPVVFAKTRFYNVVVPTTASPHFATGLELARIEMVSKMLPIDILPKAGKRTSHSKPFWPVYAPKVSDREIVVRTVSEEDTVDRQSRVAVLDAVKYELTLLALKHEIVGLDMGTQITKNINSFTVEVMNGNK